MKALSRILWTLVPLLLTVGCDQATKQLASSSLRGVPTRSFWGDTFRLVYAENSGAFLSLGSALPAQARYWLLTVVVGALLIGIIAFTLFNKKLDRTSVLSYALIAGGGVSNWYDRATRDGLVVDFMNLGIGPVRTGVFNVADLAIVAGIVILILAGWITDRKRIRAQASPPAV